MSLTIPEGVGWTALVVSAQRAAESRRSDALFRDPLAEALVERVGEDVAQQVPGRVATGGHGFTAAMGDFLPVRMREQAEVLGRPVPPLMDPDRDGMDTWLARARR